MTSQRRLIASLTLGAFLAACTAGGFLLTISPQYQWVAGLFGVLTAGAYIWIYRESTGDKTRSYRSERDPRLDKFFREWYSRPGSHEVFCNDLEWLDSIEMARARQSLAQLGDRLTVYLVKPSGAACEEIRRNGGKIFCIPPGAMSDRAPRMSIVRDQDSGMAAIRFKNGPAETVTFTTTSEGWTLGLADAYIYIARQLPEAKS